MTMTDASLIFKVRLENLGNSPTLQVSFDTRMIPFNGESPKEVMDFLKTHAADKPDDKVGIVLFPTQFVDNDEYTRISFKSLPPLGPERSQMSFYVVMLATYRMSNSTRPHYTGKVYTLTRINESGPDEPNHDFAVGERASFPAKLIKVAGYGPGSFAT